MMKAKTKITRLWSILLALVMVVGMLPTTALAADETAVFISGNDSEAALALLGSGASWKGDTNTLTLKGVNFTTTAAIAVKLPADATIVLAEGTTNTITGGNSASEGCYGIYAEGSLTISGSGTLNVTGGNTTGTANGSRSCGIYTDQALTISGGTVKAYGGATYKASLGIYSKNNINISGTADVTAIGGTATADGSFGINAEGEVIISGGEVKATGGTGRGSDGIYSGRSKVTITGGTVMAIGGDAPSAGWSVGIYAINGEVAITGGSVTSAANRGADGTFLFKGNVTASGFKTISFNKNGGSGKMEAYTYADSYTLPANGFTPPDGKQFMGWSESSTGSVIEGTAIPATDGKTLYAIWKNNAADFTDGNGTAALALLNAAKTGTTDSTWDSDTKTLTLNGVNFTTTAAIAVKLPANATIVLHGVNTIKGGDSATENCYGIYVDNGSLTIQGKTAGTGKLIVNGGSATGKDMDSYGIRTKRGDVTITGGTVEVTGGAATHKSSGIYARREKDGSGGYIGGNINISGGAEVTAAGGEVTDSTSLSYGLFANEAMTISGGAKVTATGGTSNDESYGIRVFHGDATISGGTVIAKAGNATNKYALNKQPRLPITGYSWRTSDSGVYYDPDYSWDDTHTYVEIKSNPTVTFDVNGANASVAPAFGTTNAAGKLSTLPTPTRNGYTFKEWNTKQDGSGTKVTPSTIFNANTTVYAQWTAATYTVSFDANGGTGTMADVTGISGEYTLPANGFTAPNGKQFKAWSVGGVEKAAGDTITVNADTTVTAIWENIPVTTYTIIFDANGGSVTPASAVTGDDGKLTSLPTPTRSGYTFNGWYTEGGAKVDAAYVFGTDTTIYAQWTSIPIPTPIPIYTPPTYKVESAVSKDADGSVSFSQNSAKKGDAVTITVTPDRYYKTSGVIVKDASGRMIAVTDNGNGTFTFQMPASKVTVEPVFAWDNPFGDVAEDTYYTPAVEWALKNEVTDGTSATTFSPNAGCTRGQIVTFLWRAAGCPEPAGMSSFTDVSADAYYAKAVAWAVEQGITGGTGDGTTFSPDLTCTRDQTVTFLWRAAGKPAVTADKSFADVSADAWYATAVAWAVENGITDGTGDGTTFSPADDCTRAQIVTFLYRFFVK